MKRCLLQIQKYKYNNYYFEIFMLIKKNYIWYIYIYTSNIYLYYLKFLQLYQLFILYFYIFKIVKLWSHSLFLNVYMHFSICYAKQDIDIKFLFISLTQLTAKFLYFGSKIISFNLHL